MCCCNRPCFLLGPVARGTGTIAFDPRDFCKFYLIKTSFTLGEPVSLVKVFTLFKLEQMFFGIQSVDRVGRCTTS